MPFADRFVPALVGLVALATSLLPAPARAAVAAPSAPALSPGFSASFWSPYWFFNRADQAGDLAAFLAAQRSSGSDQVILDWTVDADPHASDAAYLASPTLGLGAFNDTVDALLPAAKAAGMKVWVGLVVAPDSWAKPANFTSESFLSKQLVLTNAVADDLYSRYHNEIDGWYVPVEPSWDMIATPKRALRLGEWYRGITDHLHALSGLPVMVSPSMPYAALAGHSALDFVDAMRPMVAAAGVDVWNIQDGFEMTAWTPTQEVAALVRARSLVQRYGGTLWADLYTPPSDSNGQVPVAKLLPYLSAIAAAGIPESQWLFADYFAPPGLSGTDPHAVQNLLAYMDYLGSGTT